MNWKKIAEDLTNDIVRENITPKDVNPDEFERGVEVEMEHTDDPKESVEITLDHLSESKFPKQSFYYTWLDFAEEMNGKSLGLTREEVQARIEKLKQYWKNL